MDQTLERLTKDVFTNLFPQLVPIIDRLKLEYRKRDHDNAIVTVHLPSLQTRPQLTFLWKRILPGPETAVFWEAEVRVLLKYQRESERLALVNFDKASRPVTKGMDFGLAENYLSAVRGILKS